MFSEPTSINPNSPSGEEGALTKAARVGAPVYDGNWGIRHLRLRVPAQPAGEGYDFLRYCLHDGGRWDSWSFLPATVLEMTKNYVRTDVLFNLSMFHVPFAGVDVVGIDVVRQFQPSKVAREVVELLAQKAGSSMPDVVLQEKSTPSPASAASAWEESCALVYLGGSSRGVLDCGGDIPRTNDVIWFEETLTVGNEESGPPLCTFSELAPIDIWCALKAAWLLSELDEVVTLRDDSLAVLNLFSGKVVSG